MLDRRDARAGLGRGRKVDIGKDHARLLTALCQDLAPRRYDYAVAIGAAAVLMQAPLCGGEHEGAGLNGAGADEHLPMGLARLSGEGRRDGDELGAGCGERAVERGKAEVVADAEAQPPEGK